MKSSTVAMATTPCSSNSFSWQWLYFLGKSWNDDSKNSRPPVVQRQKQCFCVFFSIMRVGLLEGKKKKKQF
ncbi:hypothetical protein OIU76_019395 [Salix suchowensis]|nr:hypothetical protein OIU76_019395 [Salix suchowensis]